MNRLDFIKAYFNVVSDLGQEPKNVVVSAGGALLLLGLREESSDLDLDVLDEVYDAQLVGRHERFSSLGAYLDISEDVSLHRMPKGIEKICVDGVYMYSIPEMIKQKTALSNMPDRMAGKAEKDRADIAKLLAL